MLKEIKEKDLDSIFLLETKCFKKGAWSKQMLKDTLISANAYKICFVQEEKIVGYLLAGYNPWEAEILTVGVDSDYARRGIAKAMINSLKEFCINSKKEKIFLEVRKSNIVAINLYLSVGFKQIYIRKNYYENTEDAIIMELDISES